MRRFLCVWFPDWPIDRLRRARRAARTGTPSPAGAGEPAPAPLALTEGGARGPSVAAANAPARAAGVVPGMTLTAARARLPELVAEPVDRVADTAALKGLVGWLTRWSPHAAVDCTDGAMLETTGCAHLFGGETAMLADISRRLDAGGIAHRLGLGPTPGAAWALAHTAPGQISRLDGPVAAGLADLPVAGLRLSQQALTLLRRFGLTRIGQLVELDRAALARRFPAGEPAEAVLARLDQALGRCAEPIVPLLPPAEHAERLPCPDPLTGAEGLAAGLDRLLPVLCRRLEAAGLGARELVLTAWRADGTLGALSVRTARPGRDPAHFARLFADRLAGLDPGHGIDLLALGAQDTEAMEAAPRPLSRGMADAPIDIAALSALADRIGARLGRAAVTVPDPRASHLPERAEATRRFDGALPEWSAPDPATGPRPPRLLEQPEPVEVIAAVPDGPPVRFTWRRVARQVVRAEGPERIAPEWWDLSDHMPRARDYYRVEDAAGRRYWLFRDGLYGDGRGGAPRWFLHGLFA